MPSRTTTATNSTTTKVAAPATFTPKEDAATVKAAAKVTESEGKDIPCPGQNFVCKAGAYIFYPAKTKVKGRAIHFACEGTGTFNTSRVYWTTSRETKRPLYPQWLEWANAVAGTEGGFRFRVSNGKPR